MTFDTPTEQPAAGLGPAPDPAATASHHQLQRVDNAFRVPLALLMPSPLNVRKRRTPASVASMAESLRSHGQQQPIRVRPNAAYTPSNGRAPYEIVMGETRWRAAPDAGLPTLDAIVGEYSDQQVIELSMVENLERNDLDPLEEADGFDALLRKPNGLQGYASVPELAARFGHSPSYVYQRLKLLALCPAGREALLAGKIQASVAVLIARMPDQAEQARATTRIVEGFGGEAFSHRQAAEWLQREFMLKLSLAKFDTGATYHVAGPCHECPKRSGAAPDLFADCGAADMCQDARCFQAKAAEAQAQLLTAVREAGHTVLQGNAARRVLPNPTAAPIGHRRLSEPAPDLTDSRRTLGELLGPKAHRVVVEHPDAEGTLVELATEADVLAALKKKKLLREPPAAKPARGAAAAGDLLSPAKPAPGVRAPTAPPATPPAHAAASAAGAKFGAGGAVNSQAERERVRAQDRAASLLYGELVFKQLRQQLASAPELPLVVLRLITLALFRDLTHEAEALLFEAMGWQPQFVGGSEDEFNERLQGMDGRTLGELLALLMVAEDCTHTHGACEADTLEYRPQLAALAQHFALPLAAIEKTARAKAAVQLEQQAGPSATSEFVRQHGTTTTDGDDDGND